MSDLGYEEGQVCNRNGCAGIIDQKPSENCSCHIHAPCYSCVEAPQFCPVCEWNSKNDPLVQIAEGTIYLGDGFVFVEPVKRILDPTKIVYSIFMHSNSSQKVVGVYPEGTTREEVEKRVRGSWGGQFNYFKDGKFEYIAYTD